MPATEFGVVVVDRELVDDYDVDRLADAIKDAGYGVSRGGGLSRLQVWKMTDLDEHLEEQEE